VPGGKKETQSKEPHKTAWKYASGPHPAAGIGVIRWKHLPDYWRPVKGKLPRWGGWCHCLFWQGSAVRGFCRTRLWSLVIFIGIQPREGHRCSCWGDTGRTPETVNTTRVSYTEGKYQEIEIGLVMRHSLFSSVESILHVPSILLFIYIIYKIILITKLNEMY